MLLQVNMELSADVLDGLQIIGNSAQIPDNCIKTFIEKAIASILDPENKDPVSGECRV